MPNTNIIIENMDLRTESDRADEISIHNLSKKSTWDEGTEGGFNSEQKVPDLLFMVHEENVKKCAPKQNDDHLSELEHQVENAEVRCDTLKQQLDYMRMLCQDRLDNYSIESYNEEVYQSPESDTTLSVEKDSVKLLETTEEFSDNSLPDNSEAFSVMESGLDPSYPLTSDNDFEDHCDCEGKQTALRTSPPVTNSITKDSNFCGSFPNIETYQSIPISPENSCKSDNIENINLDHIQSDGVNNSILTNDIDNLECSAIDVGDESSLNSNTYTSDAVETVLEVDPKNGVVNPVKKIQVILNGIADSISIISQLSAQAPEPGKKECSKKHHTHKRRTTSCISRSPTLKHFENTETFPGQEILKYFPNENAIKEISYSDEQYSIQQQEKKHHHHHSCHRHRHRHQDDALSYWSTVPASNHASLQKKLYSSEERIHSSHHFKRNKCKRHRSKERDSHHLQNTFEVKSQKSYPDVRSYKFETKSKRQSWAETRRFIEIERGKILHGDSERINTLTKNSEYGLGGATPPKMKPRRIRNRSPPLTVKEEIQIKKPKNAKNYNSVVTVNTKESLKFNMNGENKQKPYDEFSGNSASKNSQNIEKTETTKQMTCIKNNKLFNDNQPGLIGNFQNENLSSFQHSCYEPSPNFSTPTFSSRVKQIDKPLMNLFNFRNIPFVVGTSTSRSHNLALNLQQALSIIKLRSASLRLGSDLATEVASSMFGPQSRPSTAVSCSQHKVFCPVAAAQMRNSKFQSPEDHNNFEYTIYDGKSEKDSIRSSVAEKESFSGTTFESFCKTPTEERSTQRFPKVLQKENVWEIDQVDDNSKTLQDKLRCTCFPTKPCIDYRKLLCEYLSNGEDQHILNIVLPSTNKKDINLPQSACRSRNGISGTQTQQKLPVLKDIEVTMDGLESPVYGRIQARSKELKDVLMNMHKDFVRLNEKYEHIQNEIEGPEDGGKKATKELEVLESELNAKENDIMIVLGLHEELKSLKQQVKALRKKASSQVLTRKPSATPNVLPREPTISIRLTRLLRTIQKFQEKLLNE